MLELEPSDSGEDAAAPVVLVELKDLKTRAGSPFRVYVERIPEEVLVDVMRQLPGDHPPEALAAVKDPDGKEASVRKWLGWAPALIERGTFLRRQDGHETRPAFYFGAPVPGAVRGSYLTAQDRTLIMNAILNMSGWTREAAAPASFHGRDGGGSTAGPDAVGVREGVGPDPVGGAA
jgi:hypothetical protein